MNSCIKCGCQEAFPSLPPCPVPAACPNPQPCAEVFDAQCIVFTLPDIECGNDVVVAQDSSIAEALDSIVVYFCQSVKDLTDCCDTNTAAIVEINENITLINEAIDEINIEIHSINNSKVDSVTGLNTDNTDPQNPIVKISVDGTTITGLGTPASPLVATGGGGGGGSNFYLQGTTTDAGSNKTGDIERPAAIYIGADSYFNTVKIGTGLGNISTNTAVGKDALDANIAGSYNTALGTSALLNNTNGGTNTAIGARSLLSNITGGQNTAVGKDALAYSTSSGNTGVGSVVLSFTTTGGNNTGIGYAALNSNTVGSNNIGIGANALVDNTTGNDNISIGSSTASNNFSNSIIIGNGATATGNNQFIVGSVSSNAGTITTGSVTQTKYWSVIINGVAVKVLLAD
jgi:hypothetical protein